MEHDVRLVYSVDTKAVTAANKIVTQQLAKWNNNAVLLGRSMARQEKAVNSLDYGLSRLSSKLNKVSIPFAGWAMSLMFAGMALQRMSSSIWKFGTKAFDDISHSVEGTVTANDMLAGSMKYLGYTTGEALQPLIQFLIPIVDAMSEWAEKNPALVAGLTGAAGLVGAVLAVGGAFKLALNGASEFIMKLEQTSWSALGNSIAKGIGIIAIGYALVQIADAYKDFKDGKLFDGILNALSAGALGYGGFAILKGKKGGAWAIAIGVALELVEQGTLFTTLFSIMGQIAGIIAGGVAEAMYQAMKIVENAWNNSMFAEIFGSFHIAGSMPRFDDIYGKTVAGMASFGKDWDSKLNAAKDRADNQMNPTYSAATGQQAVLYAENVFINGDSAEDIYKGLVSQPGVSSAFK